ncbi:MAG: hypothetical protein KC586_31585, partial [Myxococcales bacterium]|nr:hypothetical protein [Myxococcales bacterium]
KHRVEDALSATRAAVEEGIVAGGGVALVRAIPALDALSLTGEQHYGMKVLRRAIEEPLRQIAENAGVESAVVFFLMIRRPPRVPSNAPRRPGRSCARTWPRHGKRARACRASDLEGTGFVAPRDPARGHAPPLVGDSPRSRRGRHVDEGRARGPPSGSRCSTFPASTAFASKPVRVGNARSRAACSSRTTSSFPPARWRSSSKATRRCRRNRWCSR